RRSPHARSGIVAWRGVGRPGVQRPVMGPRHRIGDRSLFSRTADLRERPGISLAGVRGTSRRQLRQTLARDVIPTPRQVTAVKALSSETPGLFLKAVTCAKSDT